jgi:hypothetical protein
MDKLNTDVRFSIVPQWLLEAETSDRAIRVYALIAGYADSETLTAFPSRETLAKRAGCHVKTIDRAIAELVQIGALTKQQRKNGDEYSSNLYTIRRVPPQMSPPRDTDVAGVGTPVGLPGDTDVPLTRTTELEPINNNHLTISADKSAKTNRPHRLPEDWYPSQRLLDMFPEKWPSLDPEYEIENFINYWLGEGKPKADWDRTFQGWMSRNEKSSKPRGGAGWVKPTAAQRTASLYAKYKAIEDAEEQPMKGIGQGPDFSSMLKRVD